MKSPAVMKLAKLAIVAVALGGLVWTIGCQTSGKLVSSEESVVCPACRLETRTSAIKGLTYTKCVCPSCKQVSTVDPEFAEAVYAYVGNDIGDTVHVCDSCQAIVEKCPVCRNQM